MMNRWFRFYDEALDDPKVQKLDGETFKVWINILCLASKNAGILPPVEDIAFALRIETNHAITVVERLLNATLIDRRNGGANGYHYTPHGWDKRQQENDFRRSKEWKIIRSKIFKRDDYTCSYCGLRDVNLQCDHIIPVSRGGSHCVENLTTACRSCNASKRDKLISEWRS